MGGGLGGREQRGGNWDNFNRITVSKQTNFFKKRKNIKSSHKTPQTIHLGEQTIKITANFSSETMEARKQENDMFKLLKAYYII